MYSILLIDGLIRNGIINACCSVIKGCGQVGVLMHNGIINGWMDGCAWGGVEG